MESQADEPRPNEMVAAGQPITMNSDQSYPLGGGNAAAARLDFQHDVWKNTTGFVLHPAIRLSRRTRIADVGTGTGIWLFDLATKVPSTVQLDGFDLDLSLTPPKEWLPNNVSMHKLDIYGDIPAQYVGKYDVINLRYFLLVVKNGDPNTVLQPVLKMLKPGGWIQWSEMDLHTIHVISTDPAATTVHTKELMNFLMNPYPQWSIEKQWWVTDLERIFESVRMSSIEQVRSERPRWNLPRLHDSMILVVQELSMRHPQSRKIQEMVRKSVKEAEAAKRGIAINSDILTVIGRKALN